MTSRLRPVPGGLSSTEVRTLLNRGRALIGRSDSEYLLGTLLGRRRHELYVGPQTVGADVAARFVAAAAEIVAGRPLEYVLRRASFMDFELYVDERVLIPRGETEELVQRALQSRAASRKLPANRIPKHAACLDLGTGSGAIAIALARALPEARITATDASAAALEVARRNVRQFGLTERIALVQADLFDWGGTAVSDQWFDLIVANPPYVPTRVWEKLEPRVREHEPRIALDGGPDGLRLVRAIMQQAPAHLVPGGLLAMEIDPAVSGALGREFPMASIEQDWQGLDRYAFVEKCGGETKKRRSTGVRELRLRHTSLKRQRGKEER